MNDIEMIEAADRNGSPGRLDVLDDEIESHLTMLVVSMIIPKDEFSLELILVVGKTEILSKGDKGCLMSFDIDLAVQGQLFGVVDVNTIGAKQQILLVKLCMVNRQRLVLCDVKRILVMFFGLRNARRERRAMMFHRLHYIEF